MRLQNYSHKPKTKFYGKGSWFIGMELEVEAPGYDGVEAGLELRQRPSSICAKRDGSLGPTGWELVTQPISPELWLKPRSWKYSPANAGAGKRAGKQNGNVTWLIYDIINNLRRMRYTSYDSGRCGMHFHVSKEAFGIDGETYVGQAKYDAAGNDHLHFFRILINGDLFAWLSQRGEREGAFNYCRRRKNEVMNSGYVQQARHEAINITQRTIEVRIFRGNIREDRVRAALESVIAAVEFTKTLPANYIPENIDEAYIGWVQARAKTYPHLAARLAQRVVNREAPAGETERV